MSQSTLTVDSALKAAVAASALARELGDSFPPARAAATVLLAIFQTIQVPLILFIKFMIVI